MGFALKICFVTKILLRSSRMHIPLLVLLLVKWYSRVAILFCDVTISDTLRVIMNAHPFPFSEKWTVSFSLAVLIRKPWLNIISVVYVIDWEAVEGPFIHQPSGIGHSRCQIVQCNLKFCSNFTLWLSNVYPSDQHHPV